MLKQKRAQPEKPVNPHQAEIDRLTARVLPRVRAMSFARNQREPWLGNPAVDKAVKATIEQIFALAEEDKGNPSAVSQEPVEAPGEEVQPLETTAEEAPIETRDTKPPAADDAEIAAQSAQISDDQTPEDN